MKVQDKFSFGDNWHKQFTLKRDRIDAIEVRPISKECYNIVIHINGSPLEWGCYTENEAEINYQNLVRWWIGENPESLPGLMEYKERTISVEEQMRKFKEILFPEED